MKFELHCHSVYSKGTKIPWESMVTPGDIVKGLKKKGFGGFTITDHDTIASWKDAKKEAKKQKMVFIPGLEISTLSGHVIGLGLNKYIKPKLSLDETIEEIHNQSGIVIAPHPYDIRNEGIGKKFRKVDAVEVFNSLNLGRFENILAKREAIKVQFPMVGGSDAHMLEMLGMTANIINAHDVDTALDEIKKGRCKIQGEYSSVPVVVSWARSRMKRSYDDIIKYVDKNYSKPKASFSKFMLKRFVNSESPLWNGLGYFSISVSTLYSLIRTLKYL